MASIRDLAVLASRRGLEYAIDSLRLSMICTPVVSQHLQATFAFQSIGIQAPPPIFAPPLPTTPPGLVCFGGTYQQDAHVIPIRGLYIDALRLVVDVAAPSEVIDDVYNAIQDALGTFRAPDGAPLLGTPVGFADQSELSFAADLPATGLLSSWLAELYEAQLPGRPLRVGLQVRPLDADTSAPPIPGTTYTLDLRTGSRPDQHVWFSSAPLDSAAHAAYVERLTSGLSANGSTLDAPSPSPTPPGEA